MSVSCICSATIRRKELSPIFINLLRDQSRWVRMAAFQALGPFISTFADPSVTALLHNHNGEIVVVDHQKLSKRLEEIEEETRAQAQPDVAGGVRKLTSANHSAENASTPLNSKSTANLQFQYDESAESTEAFNDFFYWREPVADISLIDVSDKPKGVMRSTSIYHT